MNKKNKFMDFFSALGRSLMLPIATLAATGLLMGLMAALTKTQVQEALPFLANDVVVYVLTAIKTICSTAFNLIPALFSICIALGLAKKDKEIAAFAGFIGYYVFLMSASLMISSGYFDFSVLKMSTILGIADTIEMGAVAGILTGLVVAALHNKFYNIEFPVAIAFYGGKRFVSIVVIAVMTVLGQIIPFVWVPVSNTINAFGSWIGSAGHIGVFIFGFLERLLIPTGLHHILNGIFRTTSIGGVYDGIEGALNIFYQYFDKVDISVLKPYTAFLGQGKMPFMMIGLPMAALAIYRTTPDDKKKKVKALMIAGVAASMVSGITEPLEFSFMFIAPQLFLFHAIMGGISFGLMSLFGAGIGNTGGGVIDFIIYGVMVPGSRWYLVIPIGLVLGAAYYFVFKWYLTKKQISIDVNEDFLGDSVTEEETGQNSSQGNQDSLTTTIIEGLGGFHNIVAVNNCITRLRVDIKDMALTDEKLLKSTGAMGVIKPSDTHIQVIYGPKVEKIANKVREVLQY
ncbi:MAG: system, maltose/glucose-specific, component [Anaerocolumna sp.]|jgi:PTS system maltose and glucose-specific IIC component|nr:system, maltose/glucose-specific, component [Anaerocolumna sp.]